MTVEDSSSYVKRCHYEILEVSRDAEFGDIKKSFRKLALQWHPDKNSHQLDLANERFKELQEAYEVLSDPQERAWYDAHRESILRGGGGPNGNDDEHGESPLTNLWKYFNTKCYEGFSDDKKGFYAVFSDAFETIDREERRYSASSSSETPAPSFGSSESSDADVQAFYMYWSGFTTKMTFSWCDMYNTNDAPNRQIRRAMEATNRKYRNAGRRERVEQVRALISFVRRRDKRYIALQLAEKKQAEEAQKARHEQQRKKAEERLQQQRERAEAMRHIWEEQDRAMETAAGNTFRLADEDSEVESLCSSGASGSQPKETGKSSRRFNQADATGVSFGASQHANGSESDQSSGLSDFSDGLGRSPMPSRSRRKKGKEKQTNRAVETDRLKSDVQRMAKTLFEKSNKRSKKQQKKKQSRDVADSIPPENEVNSSTSAMFNALNLSESDGSDASVTSNSSSQTSVRSSGGLMSAFGALDSSSESDSASTAASDGKSSSNLNNSLTSGSSVSSVNSNGRDRSGLSARKMDSNVSGNSSNEGSAAAVQPHVDIEHTENQSKVVKEDPLEAKRRRRLERRAKRKQKQQECPQTIGGGPKIMHTCSVCGVCFRSRNQLFSHIQKSKHAVPPAHIK